MGYLIKIAVMCFADTFWFFKTIYPCFKFSYFTRISICIILTLTYFNIFAEYGINHSNIQFTLIIWIIFNTSLIIRYPSTRFGLYWKTTSLTQSLSLTLCEFIYSLTRLPIIIDWILRVIAISSIYFSITLL